jgi:hypothetical protein
MYGLFDPIEKALNHYLTDQHAKQAQRDENFAAE